MKLRDVLVPRSDVLDPEAFQSDLRAYRVGRKGEEDKLENSADRLLQVTFPSASIERILELVAQKLAGQTEQGAFLLMGPFGSGKTHALLTLYHVFNDLNKANEWLRRHRLQLLPPVESTAVMISAQEDQPEYLWEAIFAKAGREDLVAEVQDYPTISTLQNLVADRTLAIFIDEIEDWYDGISRDRVRLGRNRGFLQNLMSMADEAGHNLFVFVSLLDKNQELKELLRRTDPWVEDMVAVGEQQDLVLHRFFEKRDTEGARTVIRDYLEASGDYRGNLNQDRMTSLYPFHPDLFSLVQDIYDERAQGIRDTLRTLARLVGTSLDTHDYLLVSDLPPHAFKAIDPDLFRAWEKDVERCGEEVPASEALLGTAFLFSLRSTPPGATQHEMVRALLRPGVNLNDITLPLSALPDIAFHLRGPREDEEDGRYVLTPRLNVYAIINSEAKRISQGQAREKIDDLIRHKVFGGRVYLQAELEEIKGDREINVLVTTKTPPDEELRALYRNLTFGNRVIVVVPKAYLGDRAIYDEGENLTKAKRIRAEEQLLGGEVRDIEEILDELKEARAEDEERLARELAKAYGRFIRWTAEQELRKHSVEANRSEILDRAVAGVDAAYDQIRQEVSRHDFIDVRRLIDDFFRIHRFPVVRTRADIEMALRQLYHDGEIGYKGLRKTYLWPRDGDPIFTETLSIARVELLKGEEEAQAQAPDEIKPEELLGLLEREQGATGPAAGVALKEAKEDLITIVGLSPLELQELGPDDVVKGVVVEIDGRHLPMDKTRLKELIERLPAGMAIRLTLRVLRHE